MPRQARGPIPQRASWPHLCPGAGWPQPALGKPDGAASPPGRRAPSPRCRPRHTPAPGSRAPGRTRGTWRQGDRTCPGTGHGREQAGTGGHPRGRRGRSSSPPRVPSRVPTHRTPTYSCWLGGGHGKAPLLAGSPGQRPPVGQLKDLVGVEQLPETAEQVAALEASASGVHKHQQGAAVWGQLQVLTDGAALGWAGRPPETEPGLPQHAAWQWRPLTLSPPA